MDFLSDETIDKIKKIVEPFQATHELRCPCGKRAVTANKDVLKVYDVEASGDLVPTEEFVISEIRFQCKDHM